MPPITVTTERRQGAAMPHVAQAKAAQAGQEADCPLEAILLTRAKTQAAFLQKTLLIWAGCRSRGAASQQYCNPKEIRNIRSCSTSTYHMVILTGRQRGELCCYLLGNHWKGRAGAQRPASLHTQSWDICLTLPQTSPWPL